MSKLSDEQIAEKLRSLDGWEYAGGQIVRVFTFESFKAGIEFVDRVALAADEQDHHPDIDIRYTDVKIGLNSHDVGGITSRDFMLAERISTLI